MTLTIIFITIMQCINRNRRYELVIREQPQQCRMSGFGEKDRRPIDPAPIVQLIIYEDDQPIDLKEQQYPLCILHVSLWSEDQSQQLDTVQIIIRTMIGTLSSSPCVLRDQQHQLGLYFSFPDIGVRVAKTYCLKFDLVVLEE
ncbi:velvet factor [Chlamydoabsidia padenii]|nr:velvet factor [Chlamydoabsidia padenii]